VRHRPGDGALLASPVGSDLVFLLGALFWVFASFALAGPPAPQHPTSFLAGTPVVLSWSLPSVAQRIMDPPAPGHRLPWPNAFQLYSLNLPPAARRVGLAVTIATFALGIGALLAMTGAREPRPTSDRNGVPHHADAGGRAGFLDALPGHAVPCVALFAGALALRGAWKKLGWSLLCAAFIYPIPVAVLRAMAAAVATPGPTRRWPTTSGSPWRRWRVWCCMDDGRRDWAGQDARNASDTP